MGQIFHDSATTTHAIRAAIQRLEATIAELAEQYDLNPKTVQKWRKRTSVEDMPMGPRNLRSTVLSAEEEAACVAYLAASGRLFVWAVGQYPASNPIKPASPVPVARHLPAAGPEGKS